MNDIFRKKKSVKFGDNYEDSQFKIIKFRR